jgi:hypothetical protein
MVSYSKKHTTFRKLDLFSASGKAKVVTYFVESVRKIGFRFFEASTVGAPSVLPDDGNTSSFRNAVSFFTTSDRGQSPETQ